jgi:hypothetical protein
MHADMARSTAYIKPARLLFARDRSSIVCFFGITATARLGWLEDDPFMHAWISFLVGRDMMQLVKH